MRRGWWIGLVAAACGATPRGAPPPTAPRREVGAPTSLPAADPASPPPHGRQRPSESSPPQERPIACHAPSLTIRGPADSRDAAGLTDCRFEPTGHDAIGDACGTDGFLHPVSLDRLDEAVPALDGRTAEQIRAIAARGRERGRNPRAFGLVGDSITASPKFMTPFSEPHRTELSDEVRERLLVSGGGTIVEVYRDQNVRAGMDSFVAPRAAKIGAQSRWAIEGKPDPLGKLIEGTSPAVAIVLYGSNDAAVRYGELDDLVAQYRDRMTTIVDRLEEAGIVPVLSTVPRHTLDPKRAACDRGPGHASNWRMAVQTSALSAAAAELACERALPLVDLRWALDATLNHGIGPDGVHPNAYRKGSGVLDERGLQCGYNVRNYVTLRMLARIWTLLHD